MLKLDTYYGSNSESTMYEVTPLDRRRVGPLIKKDYVLASESTSLHLKYGNKDACQLVGGSKHLEPI